MEAVQALNTGWIYVIRNKINNKVYVGQTKVGLEARFNQHKAAVYNGSCCRIHCAMRKHGIENFYIEELEEVDIDQLDEREAYWVGKLDAFEEGYNSTTTGQGFSVVGQNGSKRPLRVRSAYIKEHLRVLELEKTVAILQHKIKIGEQSRDMYKDLANSSTESFIDMAKLAQERSDYCEKLEAIAIGNLESMTLGQFLRCKKAIKKMK